MACIVAASSIGAAAWLAQPGAAAAPASCHGHVSVAQTGTTHDVDENALEYVFGCSEQIQAFSVFSSSKELSQYGPGALVLNAAGTDATANGNKEFECGGDLPGFAHNCGKGIAKGGYTVRGEIGATDAPCTGEPTQWWLLAVDSAGNPHGPFNMGVRTRGCPKPKTAKTKKAKTKSKKSH
jgi:hypothetical protein